MFAASCLHPEVTTKGIRDGVAGALKTVKDRKPYKTPAPYNFAFDWNTTTIASTCDLIPGVRKTSPRVTEYKTDDLEDAMKVIVAELLLALQVGQKKIYG